MFAFLGALVYGAFKLYEHLMRERESDDFIFEEIYDPLIIKKNGKSKKRIMLLERAEK